MSSAQDREVLASRFLIGVVLASLAIATPWGTALRHSIAPALPRFVVIAATLIGVAELVSGAVAGLGGRHGRYAAALPMTLGMSALLMALSFLPGELGTTPRLLPVIGASFFAVGAAALQRRAHDQERI